MEVTEQLIYNNRSYRPRTIADLDDGILEVIEGSSHVDSLNELKLEHPDLS